MSDEKWYDDHDGWAAQFNNMLNEALGGEDPEALERLDDYDEMAMSNIAAKLKKGSIDIREAIRQVAEWVAGRSGMVWHRDHESFEMEMQLHGLLEITDLVKVNLLVAGEVGLADGILECYADPACLNVGFGDAADIENPPKLGMCTKGWFHLDGMGPGEVKNFMWAVSTAVKEKLAES